MKNKLIILLGMLLALTACEGVGNSNEKVNKNLSLEIVSSGHEYLEVTAVGHGQLNPDTDSKWVFTLHKIAIDEKTDKAVRMGIIQQKEADEVNLDNWTAHCTFLGVPPDTQWECEITVKGESASRIGYSGKTIFWSLPEFQSKLVIASWLTATEKNSASFTTSFLWDNNASSSSFKKTIDNDSYFNDWVLLVSYSEVAQSGSGLKVDFLRQGDPIVKVAERTYGGTFDYSIGGLKPATEYSMMPCLALRYKQDGEIMYSPFILGEVCIFTTEGKEYPLRGEYCNASISNVTSNSITIDISSQFNGKPKSAEVVVSEDKSFASATKYNCLPELSASNGNGSYTIKDLKGETTYYIKGEIVTYTGATLETATLTATTK
ncbi:MAG: hypothetical protein J6X89_00300 [Bacteroidales bacterium]|nr:hypothetical protein [Bacteroidales bacterium]